MDIKRKILSNQINKWVFSRKRKDIYLVGGYVRDLLLNRESVDRDFIVKDKAREIAKETSIKFKGTFIELYKKQTYRVALKREGFIDFSNIYNNITDDLNKRDFTINAIAWSPEEGIVAPESHLNDLTKGLIKAVSYENLKDDPLRILRAYRFSAQLGFEINAKTRYYLKKYSSRLTGASKERISEEFIKILNNDNSHQYINDLMKDNVLSKIIKSNHLLLLSFLNDLKRYDNLASGIDNIMINHKSIIKLKSYLNSSLSMGLTRSGLIRLSLLLRDSGADENIYNIPASSLLLSRKINKGINLLLFAHNTTSRLSKTRFLQILRHAKGYEYESAFILAQKKSRSLRKLLIMTDYFMSIKNNRLLDGNDVKRITGPIDGVRIRSILDGIDELRFMDIIKSRADARHWILSNLT